VVMRHIFNVYRSFLGIFVCTDLLLLGSDGHSRARAQFYKKK